MHLGLRIMGGSARNTIPERGITRLGTTMTNETKTYRGLLDECLYALNILPRQRIADGDGGDTYKLAAKIEQAFKTFDAQISDDERPQGLFL